MFFTALFAVGGIVLAMLAPRRVPAAARSQRQAGFSPLWLLLALAALLVPEKLLFRGNAPVGWFVLLGLQVVVGSWVVYKHRAWPWAAVLLALTVVLLTWHFVWFGGTSGLAVGLLITLVGLVYMAWIPAAVAFVLLAPRVWEGAAQDKARARISPLWFLLTLGLLALPQRIVESHMLAILIAQVVVASPFVYLHRQLPWSALVFCALVIAFTWLSWFLGSLAGGMII